MRRNYFFNEYVFKFRVIVDKEGSNIDLSTVMLCAIGGLFKVCEIKEMNYKVGELLSPRLSLFLVFFKEPLKAVMVFTLRKKIICG